MMRPAVEACVEQCCIAMKCVEAACWPGGGVGGGVRGCKEGVGREGLSASVPA